MRSRMTWLACALALGAGSFAALSLTKAQNPSSSQSPPSPPPPRQPESAARDLSKLSVLGQQMFLSAQRAGDWLRRANRPDGRFVCGYVPALKPQLEGAYYLRQVGAAFALARVARFLGEEHYAVLARQAILTLLLDTSQDSADPQTRHTILPSVVVNRVAAAGLL